MISMLAFAVIVAALALGAVGFRLWGHRRRLQERRVARARMEAASLHRRYGAEAMTMNARALARSKSPRRQRRLKAIERALQEITDQGRPATAP